MNLSSLKYLLKEGGRNVLNNRLMSLASIGILFSCLLLTGASILFTANVSKVMDDVGSDNVINVYMYQNVSEDEIISTGEEIENIPNIETCVFVSKEEALQTYAEMLGPLFDGLQQEESFLPDAYKITLKDSSLYEQTLDEVQNLKNVEEVTDKSDAASKLASLNRLVTIFGFWIVVALSIISLFIISNTIRMTMYNRRLEISIMKSVGATNKFIRIPFIVEGIIIGIFSALLSIIILSMAYGAIAKVINNIIPFTPLEYSTMAPTILLAFILSGILFGTLGGLISIRKYLKIQGGDVDNV